MSQPHLYPLTTSTNLRSIYTLTIPPTSIHPRTTLAFRPPSYTSAKHE
jgi:hypothetical protein